MPLIPIATFLAGALLSLLLPVALLLGLAGWYWLFLRRVPETPESSVTANAGPTTTGEAGGPPAE